MLEYGPSLVQGGASQDQDSWRREDQTENCQNIVCNVSINVSIPCLPSAPVLGMLAVLAALVTAWVFYQINMLGWSAQGLERLLYFQLLFVSSNQ